MTEMAKERANRNVKPILCLRATGKMKSKKTVRAIGIVKPIIRMRAIPIVKPMLKVRFCAHCGQELREDEHNIAESDWSEVCDDCFDEDSELEEMFF